MTFELHERLAADSLHLGDLPLCQLRLINDSRFYWLLLVPRLEGATEITDLNSGEYLQLWQEVLWLSEIIKPLKQADKLNVATLGNLVPQLHLHLIARFKDDAAWPAPVWGRGEAIPWETAARQALIEELKEACRKLDIQWQV